MNLIVSCTRPNTAQPVLCYNKHCSTNLPAFTFGTITQDYCIEFLQTLLVLYYLATSVSQHHYTVTTWNTHKATEAQIQNTVLYTSWLYASLVYDGWFTILSHIRLHFIINCLHFAINRDTAWHRAILFGAKMKAYRTRGRLPIFLYLFLW